MASTFVEDHKDFVLKLRIKSEDGSEQVRRVRLPRIDINGSVSYSELVGLVVSFTFPDDGEDPQNFRITLNYQDVDQDIVTISSSDELIDAIEQYADDKVLRIDAEIKRATKVSAVKAEQEQKETAASRGTEEEVTTGGGGGGGGASDAAGSQPTGTSNNEEFPIEIGAVLDSFVGVLANAVVALQDGMATTGAQAPQKAAKAANAATWQAQKAARRAARMGVRASTKAARAATKVNQGSKKAATKAADKATAAANKASDAADDALKKAKAAIVASRMAANKSKKQLEKNVSASIAKNLSAASSNAAIAGEEAAKALDKAAATIAALPRATQQDESFGNAKIIFVDGQDDSKPAVHPRHTCDSCLRTPIVGTRYHATNLPDYDLCAACFEKYNGTEIIFESIQHEGAVPKPAPVGMKAPEESANEEEIETDEVEKEAAAVEDTEAENEEAEEEQAETEEEEEERPFIHGRHTCDSCLTTPIVGKRYHAKNLPDYDLCSKCFDSYTGTEVAFEAVELDRDRPKQDAWHKRRDRLISMMHEDSPGSRRKHRCGPRPFGPGVNRGRRGPGMFGGHHAGGGHHQPPYHFYPGPPPPFGPHAHHHPHGPPPPPPFGPPPPPPPPPAYFSYQPQVPIAAPDYNKDLEEAIRRSLRECMTASLEPKTDVFADAQPEPSAPVEEEIVVPPLEESIDIEAQVHRQEDAASILSPEEKAAAEESIKIPIQVETVENEDDEDYEVEMKPAAVVKEVSTPNGSAALVVMDESFASDAVGNGDVAEAMGAMLDKVAGEISDMLASESKDGENGATIIENEADAEEKKVDVSADSDEWHLVGETESETESPKDNDMARAAEMLGSALFNSDMQNSGEAVSALSHSEGSCTVSSATSVPTTVVSMGAGTTASHVSDDQRSRWAFQLKQLAELGFTDETACIEILERLSAANIGVESEEEVSVGRVVNEILKQNGSE